MKESGGQVLPLSPSWQFLLHLCQSLWLQSCWITDPHHYCKVSVLSSPYHKTNVPNNTCSYSLILSTQNRADDGCLLIITSLKLTRSSSLYSQSPTTTTSHPPNPRSPADQPSNNVSIDLPRYPLLLSACIIKKVKILHLRLPLRCIILGSRASDIKRHQRNLHLHLCC